MKGVMVPLREKKILLVYHSGTGSTKTISEVLSVKLKEKEYEVDLLKVRASPSNHEELLKKDYDFFIFGTPVHTGKPSKTMQEFVERIEKLPQVKRAFLFCTCAVLPADSLRYLHEKLKEKNIIGVGWEIFKSPGADAIAWIPPIFNFLYRQGAYLSTFGKDTPAKIKRIINFIDEVMAKEDVTPNLPPHRWYATTFVLNLAQSLDNILYVPKKKKIHILEDRCVNCKLCIKVCNRGCYTEGEKTPKVDVSNCEFCLGCVHNCPKRAIVWADYMKDLPRLDMKYFKKLKEDMLAQL